MEAIHILPQMGASLQARMGGIYVYRNDAKNAPFTIDFGKWEHPWEEFEVSLRHGQLDPDVFCELYEQQFGAQVD